MVPNHTLSRTDSRLSPWAWPLILISILLAGCSDRYSEGFRDGHVKGFEDGRAEGYSTGYGTGMARGHAEGLKQGLAEAARLYEKPSRRDLRTLSGLWVNGQAGRVVFWLLAGINLLAVLLALGYLVFRVSDGRVAAANGLVFALASLAWFRFAEPGLVMAGFLVDERASVLRTLIEVGLFVLALAISGTFDKCFLRQHGEHLWADIFAVAFGTWLLYLLVHLLLNHRLLLASGMDAEPLHYVAAFTAGGLLYCVYALVDSYVIERDKKPSRPGDR